MNYSSEYALIIDLIKYLDDDVMHSFIAFIFDKKNGFYNPYDTNKELFLRLALSSTDDFSSECMSYDKVLSDKNLALNMSREERLKNYNKLINNNTYLKLLNSFSKTEFITINGNEFVCNENTLHLKKSKHLTLLIELYNDKFITFNTKKDCCVDSILKILGYLSKTLNSFEICFKGSNIKFFNFLIKDLIQHKRFYEVRRVNGRDTTQKQWLLTCIRINDVVTPKEFYESKYIIIEKESKLYLFEYTEGISEYKETETTPIIGYYKTGLNINNKKINNRKGIPHALLSAKSISSFINSLKNIDTAVNKLKNLEENEGRCHICQSIMKKTPHCQSPMCKKCAEIVAEIKKINPELKRDSIIYFIKKRNIGLEKNANLVSKKEFYYRNLIKYLKYLNKTKPFQNIEKTKSLENLINQRYSEFGNFYFEKLNY